MKKYIIISFLLLVVTQYSFSQEKNIEFFIKDEQQKPIENVYVIAEGKPITLSDKTGKIILAKHILIKLQHLSYETKEIDTKSIDGNSITMITHINQLQEVNVLPTNTLENILKECFKRFETNYPTGNLQYFKMNHYATSQGKTVISLDGNLKINLKSYRDFNHNNDIFIDENTNMSRSYFEEKDFDEYNYFISPSDIFETMDFNKFDFLTNVRRYDYFLLSSNPTEYEISFSPKEEKKFIYSGKIIINKIDFGIRLIDMALVNSNKNIRTTVISGFKPVDQYSFNEEKTQLSFHKKENKYYLESAFYVASMQQLKTSKIGQPKSFFSQIIVVADNGKGFGTAKEINLSNLTLIKVKLPKAEEELSGTKKKMKEKVEKLMKENEQN